MKTIEQSKDILYLLESFGWFVVKYPKDKRYVDAIEAWNYTKKISMAPGQYHDLIFTFDYGSIDCSFQGCGLYQHYSSIDEETLKAIITLGQFDPVVVEIILLYRNGKSIRKALDYFIQDVIRNTYFLDKPIDWESIHA